MELELKGKIFDQMNDEEFTNFCVEQDNIRIERNADKTIIIMSPSLPEYSEIIGEIIFQLKVWNKKKRMGKIFESSAGFFLPNKAMRAPDCAYVSQEKWDAARKGKPKSFPYVVPDFVVEVRSGSDTLASQKNKMEEWINNGALLGWLIDVKNQNIFVYAPQHEVKVKAFADTISGEDVLPGFVLDTSELQ